ncbi:bifunctional (p)ppGpp synthetase/guanosine-3',5'-bis(diphosphate) 3'-pyrophosphohydrolase, partial [bacterium]|nr:bifunctional (p)ppGpp synthetase/guanosine-3',5'-bis(diphosphate) 3'-pyrophosphohydrolase [bacterium]
MHEFAELGVAAHWRYKEGSKQDIATEKSIASLRQLLEEKDGDSLLASFRTELFADRVYVLTPAGELIDLVKGATPLDFAYAIHTEVGHRCNGAKVNGRIVPLTYNLKNGDIVEILTGKTENPNRSWLKIVRSSSSKSKIKSWFKQHERVITVGYGKKIFLETLENLKGKFKNHYDILPASTFNLKDIVKSKRFSDYTKQKYNNLEQFYYALGNNEDNPRNIIRGMFPEIEKLKLQDIISGKKHKPKKSRRISSSGVIVEGIDDVLIKLSKCCTPIPGDSIIGFITRGKGISVHRKDCPNIKSVPEKERLITVRWDTTVIDKKNYSAVLKITARDRPNLLLNITNLLASYKLNISRLSAFTKQKGHAIFMINLEISSIENLENLISAIGSIPNVDKVFRTSI